MPATIVHAGFIYTGTAAPALEDISLEIVPGTMTAVLGAVGSGTSTLCRLLGGLLESRGTPTGRIETDGTVAVLGDDPEAQLSGLTSHVGDETQLACRLHGLAPATAEARARQALSDLSIDGLWSRDLDTLSGGQRQLVALSRIIALAPDLLILDQPSQSLDPLVRRGLAVTLRAYCAQERSVLITGHQVDELTLACDEVLFLDTGTLTTGRETAEESRVSRVSDSDFATACRAHDVWDTRTEEAAPQPTAVPARAVPASTRPTPAPTQPAPAPASSSPILTVQDLNVARHGNRILDGIDLELHPGELVAITGANGAGKTTLLRSLIGLLDRTASCSGTITAGRLGEGPNLAEMPAHARSRSLGWVGQDPGVQLSATTVRGELMLAVPLPRHRRRDRKRVRAQRRTMVEGVLRDTGLSTVSEEHPFDLDVPRRKDLVIASALIADPRVMLLDEPTIGRDLLGMHRLDAVIAGFLRRGGAVLATTHDRRWARESSHRLLHLAEGRLSRP